MAFEPLKDDAVRRSRKFIGRHKGLLTEPGARAVDFVRRNGKLFGLASLLVVVGLGAMFAYRAWEAANSEEALRQAEARDEAIEQGSWSALLEYAEHYGLDPQDEALLEAFELAYRDEVERVIAQAEQGLRAGEPDAVLELPGELDELTHTWLDHLGEQEELPVSIDGVAEGRLERFKRRAVSILERQLAHAADEAETQIEQGTLEPAVAGWREEKQAVRTLMGTLTFPARERDRLDGAMEANETSVLRALEQRQAGELRTAYEQARGALQEEPMALDDYLGARTRKLEEARRWADEYNLSERSVISLERSATQYAEELARLLRGALAERIDQERARASQALLGGTAPAEAIDQYRTQTASTLDAGRASGLFEVSEESAEFLAGRIQDGESRLREVALREAEDDLEHLQALHLRYESSDPLFAERVAERIRYEMRRQGDYHGAAEFGDPDAQILAPFDRGFRAFWVDREPGEARGSFEALLEAEAERESSEGTLKRLQALARGYLTLIENHPGSTDTRVRQELESAATLVPDMSAATYPLEAMSVGYFQMVRGNFAEAAVRLREAQSGLGPGVPMRYLLTVAEVRAADAQPEVAAALFEEESLAEQDRDKLVVLRYWAHVSQRGEVYDTSALEGLEEMLESESFGARLAQLNRDANLSLSESELRFSLGAIRYFYFYERAAGVRQMQTAGQAPYSRAANLFGALVTASHPSEGRVSLESLYDVEREAEEAGRAWPLLLVQAYARLQIGLESHRGQRARHMAQATDLFDRLASSKPTFMPMARAHQSWMATFLRDWGRSHGFVRQALEALPEYAEGHYRMGDLMAAWTNDDAASDSEEQAIDDPEFAIQSWQAAAGLDARQPVEVAYPRSLYRLATGEGLTEGQIVEYLNESLRSRARERYRAWHEGADDLARREFPGPPAGQSSDEEPEEDKESETPDGAFNDSSEARPLESDADAHPEAEEYSPTNANE